MKVLTVTGYKPMEMNIFRQDDPRIEFIRYALRKRLIPLIEEGIEWVIISGQSGVELWTAEVVLDLKETYEVNLGIIPPFENQEQRWPEHVQLLYQEITMCADFYEPLYKGDYKGPYQFRSMNMWFVNKSNACLILMDEEFPGSTRYFYEQAKQAENYPIYIITPADLEDAVQEWQMNDPRYWE